MANFSRLIITAGGQALVAKSLSGAAKIEFTKIAASSREYSLEQLETLTELSDVEQSCVVSKVSRTSDNAVMVEAPFSNHTLTAGYYMRALGLYAYDSDEGEILYAMTLELSGGLYMPPYNGTTVSGINPRLITTVGNADNISLKVDPAAVATIGQIEELEQLIIAHTHEIDDVTGLREALDDKANLSDIPSEIIEGGNASTLEGKHAEEFADAAHLHRMSDVEGLIAILNSKANASDIPSEIIEGGNASTLEGMHAEDFAKAEHAHTVDQISGLPASLPADGGNADTVDGKHASDFAQSQHTHTASEISGLPTSLPANGGNADSAAKATQDSSGQQINTTYIKGLSVSGKTITYTKGDGATGTLTTQDTTYSNMKAATSSAAGAAGLVPAPAAGAQGKYLRGDGTWQTPPDTNTTYAAASATAAGLVSTAAQTFAGDKTFNGNIIPAGATDYSTPQARKLASGTAAATTTNCPSGAWYGQHS